MKVLFVVFFVAYVCAEEEGKERKTDTSFLDKINDEVEKSRQNFPEPFVINELSYELPANQLGRVFSGHVSIKNLVLTGVKNFKFKAGIIPPLISFSLPRAKLDVDYSLDLLIFDVDILRIDGSGHISVELSGVDLEVQINPTIFQGPKESLKKITVGLKKAKFSITGLLDDEALSKAVTKWVNANIMQVLQREVGYIGDLVKMFLNAVLPDYIALMNKRE